MKINIVNLPVDVPDSHFPLNPFTDQMIILSLEQVLGYIFRQVSAPLANLFPFSTSDD
jgi:hypothetical protein